MEGGRGCAVVACGSGFNYPRGEPSWSEHSPVVRHSSVSQWPLWTGCFSVRLVCLWPVRADPSVSKKYEAPLSCIARVAVTRDGQYRPCHRRVQKLRLQMIDELSQTLSRLFYSTKHFSPNLRSQPATNKRLAHSSAAVWCGQAGMRPRDSVLALFNHLAQSA